MYRPIHCISLRRVRYDDRRSILTAWSAEAGRVSLIIPDGAGREAARRRALTQPLALFEGQVDQRPGREILSMRDLRPSAIMAGLAADPAKTLVALFVAEVLERALRESAPDDILWRYLTAAITALDTMPPGPGVANFPPVFLYHLAACLGIAPDAGAWRPGLAFDLAAARFAYAPGPLAATQGRTLAGGNILTPQQAAWIPRLARLTLRGARLLPIPRPLRREMLDIILRYYTLHHTPLDNLRSLPVLTQIF